MTGTKEYGKIRQLAEQYDIGAILFMAPLSSGNTCHAWRIDSEKGSWILRKCHSIMSAADEYALSEALFQTDITPVILHTKEGERFVFGDNGVFNLQTRIEGEPLTDVNEDIMRKTAAAFVTVHRILKDAKIHLHFNDRFGLHSLSWENITKAAEEPGTAALIRELDELYRFEADTGECIHGDAGIWNILLENGEIRIIDFGEARMGNTYLDHAGFLVSALEQKDPETAAALVKCYMDASAKAGRQLDPAILHKAVRLWLLRGVFAALAFENHRSLIERTMKTNDLFHQVFREL